LKVGNVFPEQKGGSNVYPLVWGSMQALNSTTTASGSAVIPLWVTIAQALVAVGVVVVIGTAATRLVRGVVLRAGGSKSVSTTATQWIGVITVLAAVGVLSTIAGLSSYLTALTVSGIAGLAVSLALQNTISNVIAGVLMQHDGIIRLGDDVQYQQGGVRGEVVKLSLRSTWLKTKDGVLVVLSNSNIASGPILNYTSLSRLDKRLG
jgi:small conductance mechanosensitive channel